MECTRTEKEDSIDWLKQIYLDDQTSVLSVLYPEIKLTEEECNQLVKQSEESTSKMCPYIKFKNLNGSQKDRPDVPPLPAIEAGIKFSF